MDYICASTEPPMRWQSKGLGVGRGAGSGEVVDVPQGIVHAVVRENTRETRCGAPLEELHLVAVDFWSVVDGRCVCCLDKVGAR